MLYERVGGTIDYEFAVMLSSPIFILFGGRMLGCKEMVAVGTLFSGRLSICKV